jgi:Ca-activated chloride channel family protein
VDQFDQLGSALGDDQELPPGDIPAEDGVPGTGISMIMMEQWLERIEGDPAYLMRNQFMIEEQLEMQRSGRRVMETRPW